MRRSGKVRPLRAAYAQRSCDHPGNLSLDMVDRFLDALLLEEGVSEATSGGYRSNLRSAEVWLWRRVGRSLVSASSAHLLRHLRDLQASGLPASGVTRRYRSLRRFYRWLQAIGAREDDPMRDARMREWWTQRESAGQAEQQRARRAAMRERNRLMFAMMLWGGLSVRDVISLRLRDLSPDGLTIEPRGAPAGRIVLTASLSKLLRGYIDGARNTLLGRRQSDYLFPSRSGEPLAEDACSRTARALGDAFWSRAFPSHRPTATEPE